MFCRGAFVIRGLTEMKKHFIFLSLSLCLFAFVPKTQSSGQTEQDSTVTEASKPDTLLKNKSPMGALLRSVVFPGGGQFYNRKYLKGIVVFGTETTFITLAAIEWSRANTHKKNFQNPEYPYSERYWEFEQFKFYEDRRNLFLWITAGVVFLSMFDAYVDAHLYNFDKEKVRDLTVSLIPEGKKVKIVFCVEL
jgi:hypothetical protein